MAPTLTALALVVFASPALSFEPPEPRLGDLIAVYVHSSDRAHQRGSIQAFDLETPLFRVSSSLLRGLVPVPLSVESGRYDVRVLLGDDIVKGEIQIADREFEQSELSVSRRFTKKKGPRLRARLRREREAMKAVWRAPPTNPRFSGTPERPVDGAVTARYGTRRVFNGKTKSRHYGLDLDGKTGDPIRAAADGRVVMSSMRWGSGGTIVIDHGGGLFTSYFHMSQRAKKRGDLVRRGEVIGAVGKTGRVTGPHLHLGVVVRSVPLKGRRKGRPRSMYVDPEAFLEMELKSLWEEPSAVTETAP